MCVRIVIAVHRLSTARGAAGEVHRTALADKACALVAAPRVVDEFESFVRKMQVMFLGEERGLRGVELPMEGIA